MSWYEKERPTPFDELPLPGLWFLDGDVLAKLINRNWTEGQKYPQVTFPSGEEFDIWESSQSEKSWGIVHIFGEMDLPYRQSRDEAFESANYIAEQVGYMARMIGEHDLEVWGHDEDEHFLISYDPVAQQMQDIKRLEALGEAPVPPGLQLMNETIQTSLPGLEQAIEQGLKAMAQVKYFTPDSNWTWYISGFDGQDTMYGLVIGLEIEMGGFSLSELKEVRGSLGLQIERDIYFEPQTLAALRDKHRRERE